MKTLMEKFDALLLKMVMAWNGFVEEERGDTNFLSIAIVLVVVLVLAVVFINFGKSLLPKLQQAVDSVTKILP